MTQPHGESRDVRTDLPGGGCPVSCTMQTRISGRSPIGLGDPAPALLADSSRRRKRDLRHRRGPHPPGRFTADHLAETGASRTAQTQDALRCLTSNDPALRGSQWPQIGGELWRHLPPARHRGQCRRRTHIGVAWGTGVHRGRPAPFLKDRLAPDTDVMQILGSVRRRRPEDRRAGPGAHARQHSAAATTTCTPCLRGAGRAARDALQRSRLVRSNGSGSASAAIVLALGRHPRWRWRRRLHSFLRRPSGTQRSNSPPSQPGRRRRTIGRFFNAQGEGTFAINRRCRRHRPARSAPVPRRWPMARPAQPPSWKRCAAAI